MPSPDLCRPDLRRPAWLSRPHRPSPSIRPRRSPPGTLWHLKYRRSKQRTVRRTPSPQLSGAGPHASSSRGCRAVADARTFRFASPEGKRMTGKMKRMAVRFRPSPFASPSRPRRAPWSAPRACEQSGRTCHCAVRARRHAVPALSCSAAFRPTPALRRLVGRFAPSRSRTTSRRRRTETCRRTSRWSGASASPSSHGWHTRTTRTRVSGG